MTSRERILTALKHKEPDRVPVDLGGTAVTGMHVSVVAQLRQALGLDKPGTPVKVVEPYQMLGEIAPDLVDALELDVLSLAGKGTFFGFLNEDWKPWTTFDGTPVLVPGKFNTEPEPNGDILQYPQGEKSAPASGRMPKGGFYFDSIIRQEPIDDAALKVEDNLEEFQVVPEEAFAQTAREAEELHANTDKAVVGAVHGTNFGDISQVPAPWLKYPKGIRDVAEWYMSLACRRDFVYEIFDRQCEIALKNLERFHNAVGDKIHAIFITGTDFGTQAGPFISPEVYCDLFQPFHRRVNDWVHRHTSWFTWTHCCGSIVPLIDHFIDAGFDVLNPVQTSADNMDPKELKERFGDRLTFWGGGVDTQHTLPFGTPGQVRDEVRRNIEILAPGGGFVFNPIHNVQAGTPVENVLAMFDAVREYGGCPIQAD